MKIESVSVEALTIVDAPALDPIRVFLQDIEQGKGRIVIECYGVAWSAFWGAMGQSDLRGFVSSCDPIYLANCLSRDGRERSKKAAAYLLRIVVAVKQALAMTRSDAEGSAK